MVDVTCLATERYVNAVAWNKNGTRVAALSGFGSFIRIWDAATFDVVADFERYGGAYNGNSFAFLHDGSLLLPAPIGRSPDPPYQELFLSSFEQIDADTGERIRYIKDDFYDRGRRRIMDTFAVAPGGLIAAGIPTGNPSLISLFDTASWTLTRNIDLSKNSSPSGFARSLALSHDGLRLAVGTANGFLKVYDTASGDARLEQTFADASYAISAVAFSRDGAAIAVGGSKTYGANGGAKRMVRFLDVASNEVLGLPLDTAIGNVYSLSFAANGLIAIAGSNTLAVAQLSRGTLRTVSAEAGHDFYSVSFSVDGRLAASKGSTVLVYPRNDAGSLA